MGFECRWRGWALQSKRLRSANASVPLTCQALTQNLYGSLQGSQLPSYYLFGLFLVAVFMVEIRRVAESPFAVVGDEAWGS